MRGNDDATRSISLLCEKIADAAIEGKARYQAQRAGEPEEAQGEQAGDDRDAASERRGRRDQRGGRGGRGGLRGEKRSARAEGEAGPGPIVERKPTLGGGEPAAEEPAAAEEKTEE